MDLQGEVKEVGDTLILDEVKWVCVKKTVNKNRINYLLWNKKGQQMAMSSV